MNEQVVIDLAYEALQTVLFLVGPSLITAMIVGIAIAIFQAVTSIQDMSLTFVPKIVAVGMVILLMGSIMMNKIVQFAQNIFINLDKYI